MARVAPLVREPTLNKQDIVDIVSESVDAPKSTVSSVLDAVLRTVKASVAEGDSVQLMGFGEFHATERAARTGRNPNTGEPMEIAAVKTVKFTAGKDFKDVINS
ncbi:HU family DNA-binding protein [Streptomyces sp. ME02-6979.5a]|uniref:HU family DNA-binding protein n=1 Tax=Streptomyces sp. ME02-6979.5a TaxID=462925 RepID=UPI0029A87AA2|nr:HU family DNA-binding protein [Streptomyces sp. ME02-6979.5a]MDX3342835.1 HU family DNA-binding protein [Streptomyces sp. ME02-6979.5a]